MTAAVTPLAEDGDLAGTTIAVFGLGKMGLPLASVLAEAGATVHGVDIDETIVTAVNEGRCPVSGEPGLPDLVAEYGGGRLVATTDGAEAASAAEISVILVPTVLDEEKRPALEPVVTVGETIAEGLDSGNLVILESTVPPGTTAGELRAAIESGGLEVGEDIGLAHCPERTSAGRVIADLTESYPKIVGGVDPSSTEAAASLYRAFNEPGVIELPSAIAAEAVKVFEGVYRDVNIALANELGKACEEWGLDAETVIAAANTQPYCDIHTPGLGVGGHCIPVYPHFVINRAEGTPLLETARDVNDGMPAHAVAVLETLLRSAGVDLTDARVLVLGITFRPGVEETRYAPAIDTIDHLRQQGAEVLAHDPLLTVEAIETTGATAVDPPTDPTDLDAVILATGQEAYRDLDLGQLRANMRTPVLLDGRWFFDPEDVTEFTHVRIGDGRTPHPRRRTGW